MNRQTVCKSLIVLFAFSFSTVKATTVCDSGCDYTSIGTAIINTPVGGSIFVDEGIYNESNMNLSGKNLLSMQETSPESVVIDGGGNRVFSFVANALISGVTIQGGNANSSDGGAMAVAGPGVELRNCIIQNNMSDFSGGAIISTTGASQLQIDNC